MTCFQFQSVFASSAFAKLFIICKVIYYLECGIVIEPRISEFDADVLYSNYMPSLFRKGFLCIFELNPFVLINCR